MGATLAIVPAGEITIGVEAVTEGLAMEAATSAGSEVLVTGFGAV
jgi:hypothetical protein